MMKPLQRVINSEAETKRKPNPSPTTKASSISKDAFGNMLEFDITVTIADSLRSLPMSTVCSRAPPDTTRPA